MPCHAIATYIVEREGSGGLSKPLQAGGRGLFGCKFEQERLQRKKETRFCNIPECPLPEAPVPTLHAELKPFVLLLPQMTVSLIRPY